MFGGQARDPDPRRLDRQDLGDPVVFKAAVKLAPEFRDEGNVDPVIDEAVDFQDVAGLDLPVFLRAFS